MIKRTIIKKVILLKCHRCKHEWGYSGKNEFIVTCPHCNTKVTMKKQQTDII